jgi:hypothetical protein
VPACRPPVADQGSEHEKALTGAADEGFSMELYIFSVRYPQKKKLRNSPLIAQLQI